MFRLKRTIPIIIAYKAVLELLYVLDTSKVFGYYGLTVSMNFEKMVVSYILLIAILSLSPTNEKRPSTYFYFFLIIFTIVPLLCYYWLNDQNSLYILMVFVAMLTIRLVLWLPRLRVPKLVIKHELPILLLFGVIYLGLYIMILSRYGLPSAKALNFVDIYSLRQERQLTGFLGYVVNWLAKVINPFLILVFVDRKRPVAAGAVSFLQLTLYAIFGYKAFLLSIAAIFGCVLIMKRNMFLGALSGGLAILNVASISRISIALTTLIPFRMVFLPAVIQYWYYDFYSTYPKLIFSEGVIGKILGIDSPYYMKSFHLIGLHFRGFAHTVNSGMFGDAYANGGFYAMLIIALLFGVVVYIFDSLTRGLPMHFAVSSMAYMMFVLNDTGLLTALLTGGFILMMFLMYCYQSRFREANDGG